jgi:predicted transposase/invertase (TIGR01784 family)
MRPASREPTGISPRVDCVFRALLADPDHTDRLIAFLNAVLQRASPLVAVELRNPIQPSEFIEDGHIVVDVLARDASGETFQVEMQSWNQAALKERMLYGWAALYRAQSERGRSYTLLRPVVSIWILDQNTLSDAARFHHRFTLRDPVADIDLTNHLEIHVIELARWREHPDPATPLDLVGWMRFFAEAETWPDVPDEIDTPALESAMTVLTEFQVNAARNDLYRSRLDALSVQATQEAAMAEALAAKEQALAAKEEERAAKEEALGRVERLRERLRAAGIDPDA